MNGIAILRLNPAMALLNIEGADGKLAAKVMRNKIAVEDAAEHLEKQRKALKEGFKPSGYENLKELLEKQKKEVKDILFADSIDNDKLNQSQAKMAILQNEWDTKFAEAEQELLSRAYKITLEKISLEEFEILKKPRKEHRQVNEKEIQVVTTNHFYADSLAALAPILSL